MASGRRPCRADARGGAGSGEALGRRRSARRGVRRRFTGFVFHGCDLRGADFARARGKTAAMFDGAIVNSGTRGVPPSPPGDASPPDFGTPRSVSADDPVAGRQEPGVAWVCHSLPAWICRPFFFFFFFCTKLLISCAARPPPPHHPRLATASFSGASKVSDLSPLAGLTALQSLDLWGAQVQRGAARRPRRPAKPRSHGHTPGERRGATRRPHRPRNASISGTRR